MGKITCDLLLFASKSCNKNCIDFGDLHQLFVGGWSPPPKCYLHQNNVTKIWKIITLFLSFLLICIFASNWCNINSEKKFSFFLLLLNLHQNHVTKIQKKNIYISWLKYLNLRQNNVTKFWNMNLYFTLV